jgi:hypothetical protein
MKTAALIVSGIILLVVIAGALRTVLQQRFLFFRKFDKDTRDAYLVLAIGAMALLVLAYVDVHRIQSFEIGGLKTTLTDLKQQVTTLSDQVEEFYKDKRVEVFDKRNWNQVRRVGSHQDGGMVLEVTLQQPPIPGSVEVFEGVLPMPEQDFEINGRVLRFPANTDKPTLGLTIKYHPRMTNGR